MRNYIASTPLMIILCLLITAGTSFNAFAQPKQQTKRALIQSYPFTLQKKILDQTPSVYQIIDLVNYPLGFEEERQRSGFTYITVNDFYNYTTSEKLDAIVYKPHLFYISLDSSSIPPARIMNPNPTGDPAGNKQMNNMEGDEINHIKIDDENYEEQKLRYLQENDPSFNPDDHNRASQSQTGTGSSENMTDPNKKSEDLIIQMDGKTINMSELNEEEYKKVKSDYIEKQKE